MYATNDFKIDEINRLWVQIQTLFITKDIHGLQKLLSEQQEMEREVKIFQQLNTTIIKIFLSDLTMKNYILKKILIILLITYSEWIYWGEHELVDLTYYSL